jgi:hypothetical protein
MALLSSLRYKVKFNSQGENDFAIHSSEKLLTGQNGKTYASLTVAAA